MSEHDVAQPHVDEIAHAPDRRRRSLIQALAAGTGAATFFGPWKVHHAWAQSAQRKPLVVGLTMDASGQYGASGGLERNVPPAPNVE